MHKWRLFPILRYAVVQTVLGIEASNPKQHQAKLVKIGALNLRTVMEILQQTIPMLDCWQTFAETLLERLPFGVTRQMMQRKLTHVHLLLTRSNRKKSSHQRIQSKELICTRTLILVHHHQNKVQTGIAMSF